MYPFLFLNKKLYYHDPYVNGRSIRSIRLKKKDLLKRIMKCCHSFTYSNDFFLFFSVDDQKSASDIFNSGFIIVTQHGHAHWLVPGLLKASCKINVRYFPFDQQECPLHFESWTHDIQDLNLTNASPSAKLETYVDNEQWALQGVPSERNLNFYPNWPDVPFTGVVYKIQMRRKPMFALYYYILPTMLLLAIGLLVFLLPPESGERVSLGITVLLSMTVYQLLLSDIVPHTSDVVPVLGKQLTYIS